MSYILDALKKAEREHNSFSFIEIEYKKNLKKQFFRSKINSWWWVMVILAMNLILLAALLWPKEPPAPPRVLYIVPQLESAHYAVHVAPPRPNNTQALYTHVPLSSKISSSVSNQEKLLSSSKMKCSPTVNTVCQQL